MTKIATSLKLEDDVMGRAKAEAKKENRSFNNFIETILIAHFEKLDELKNEKENT